MYFYKVNITIYIFVILNHLGALNSLVFLSFSVQNTDLVLTRLMILKQWNIIFIIWGYFKSFICKKNQCKYFSYLILNINGYFLDFFVFKLNIQYKQYSMKHNVIIFKLLFLNFFNFPFI